MPNKGNQFIVSLQSTHIGWGIHRYTDSRQPISGECYIPIPSSVAHQFGIFNSNYTQGQDILGQNIFRAHSADGHFEGTVKASGSSVAGDRYAKNLSGQGDLKAFNYWFNQMNVTVGTKIKVEWLSDSEVLFTILY